MAMYRAKAFLRGAEAINKHIARKHKVEPLPKLVVDDRGIPLNSDKIMDVWGGWHATAQSEYGSSTGGAAGRLRPHLASLRLRPLRRSS